MLWKCQHSGPQLFKRLEIVGFDYGIITADQYNYTSTAEFLTIRHAQKASIWLRKHSFTIRKLVTRDLKGPAIISTTDSLLT